LEQLKRELEAYEALVAAEAKTLARHPNQKRLIPAIPLEEVKDEPISLDLRVMPRAIDEGLHPPIDQLDDEPTDGMDLKHPSKGSQVPQPSGEQLHESNEEVILPPSEEKQDEEVKEEILEPTSRETSMSKEIMETPGDEQKNEEIQDLRNPDKTLDVHHLPRSNDQQHGVIFMRGEYILAKYLPSEMLQVLLRKGGPTGKSFYEVYIDEHGKWCNPKAHPGKQNLWPVYVELKEVEKVVLPFTTPLRETNFPIG
jgi:hypothetical protein